MEGESDRENKAIDELSDGGAETGGFVTTGFRVTSSIRLLRRFEAPDLAPPPSIRSLFLLSDTTTTQLTVTSAS